jgi:hypothetical protein
VNDHLLASRRADVDSRARRVRAVLDQVATHAETPLTVVEIARRAQVHKSFIHRHPELKAAIDAARAVRTQTIVGRLQTADAVTSASLKAELENEKAISRRLRVELQACRARLGQFLGSAVADEITGGSNTAWQDRAGELLEENRTLHDANRRLVEEIDAVRARNREMTRQLNA